MSEDIKQSYREQLALNIEEDPVEFKLIRYNVTPVIESVCLKGIESSTRDLMRAMVLNKKSLDIWFVDVDVEPQVDDLVEIEGHLYTIYTIDPLYLNHGWHLTLQMAGLQ